MEVFVVGIKNHVASHFETEVVSETHGKSFRSGSLVLDTTSPYFPKRGDEKIMRQDTKAAIILINELLDAFAVGLDRDEMGLYVSSGVFIENFEKHLGHLVSVFEHIREAKDEAEKLFSIYRASPPLLALQTLTNSTMSFIAQYTGIKGNNATFGTSSSAGFDAILEGMNEAYYNQNSVLVAASNVAGIYSYLMNSTLYPDQENWFESAAVGGLILSPVQTEHTICKLSAPPQQRKIPALTTRNLDENWFETINQFSSDALIYSGAYTSKINTLDHKYFTNEHKNASGIFDKIGNAGPVNLFIGIEKGCEMIQSGAQVIDLFDRDVYGRISHLKLEAIR